MISEADITEMQLLQRLSPAGRRRVCVAGSLERHKKDVVLFQQDQPARFLWLVREGWVHLINSPLGHPPGNGVVVATITADDGLCGLSALEQRAYSVSAVAATACEIVRLPAPLVEALLKRELAFAYEALRLSSHRLRRMAEQYAVVARPVPQRLVATLLRLHQQFGQQLPMTHRELAQMACTTTESAIRVIRRLKAQGYVRGRRGLLELTQPAALERLLAANGHARVPELNGHAAR